MAKTNYNIKLGLIADGFKKGISEARDSINGFARSIKSAFGMIAGAFAAGQIKAFAKECVDAYNVQMEAETKLATVMRQRMNISDEEIDSIKQLASEQQKLGVIGDEVQLAGVQQVATFLNDKKSIDTLLPAMNNLLAQQRGYNASAADAVSIGNLFGKAMQGQTAALSRCGITFSEAEAKVLKFGTEEERAAMLAQVVTNNVGEANKALAETDGGKIAQLNNTLGDLKENIGAAIMPIIAEMVPAISSMATTLSDKAVGVIGVIGGVIETVKDNITGLIAYIVGQVAGIKLTQYIVAFIAKSKALGAQLETNAAVTAAKRQAIEEKLQASKQKLAILEAQEEEATGAKKLQIAQKTASQKAAIKNQEVALDKAKDAEIVAQNELAAMKTASGWKKGMLMAKAATLGFVTSVKTAFRSFAPLLIFEVLFNVLTALYNQLMKSSEGFRNFVSIIKNAVLGAIQKVASAIGTVIDYVAELFGMSGKGAKKKNSGNVGKGNSGGKSATTPNTNIKDIGGKVSTSKTKEESDFESARKSYTEGIKKADAELKVGVTTEDEYWKKMLDLTKDAQVAAELATPKNDAEKKLIEAWKNELENTATHQVLMQGVKGKGKQLDKDAIAKTQKEPRDKTFDYKMTEHEVIVADLELDLSNAKAKLEELQKQAEDGCGMAKEMINEQLLQVTSLSDALKLEQLKEDITNLQKDLNSAIISGVQGGWEGIKNAVNDVNGMIDTLQDPDASGWEKFTSVVDTAISVLNTVMSVMEMVNNITKISTELTNANAAATTVNTEANVSNAGAISNNAAATTIATTAKNANSDVTTTNTATETSNTTAKTTNTAAETANTTATSTNTVADTANTIETTTNTAAETANAIANTTNTVAETANTTATTTNTVAETANATATTINTAATATNTGITATNSTAASSNAAAKSGEAIAAATAGGAEVPFPGSIAAIAAGVAAVVAALATTLTAFSEGGIVGRGGRKRFSTGGLVTSQYGSMNGDFIPALLNNNEMVLNPNQQNRLFNLANGGSVGNNMNGTVKFEIEARTLKGVLQNENIRSSKIG